MLRSIYAFFVGFFRTAKVKKLRIWKLGNLEHRILPTKEAIDRLADILMKWDGKSDLDLIWSPDISMEQVDLDTNAIDIIVPEDVEFGCELPTDTHQLTKQIRIVKRA